MQPTPVSVPPEPLPPAQSSSQPAAQVEPAKNQPEKKGTEREEDVRPGARPHAFIIMPFGKKPLADGTLCDFNAIYSMVIKPAVELAGFESFRADEESTSGDILTDMFQELLLAELCIADISIDNANVFYELGIRHAFRKRGIVHIQAGRSYMPFDVFNVRTVPYHITPEGVPDPAFLEKDRAAIARVIRDTASSDLDLVHSPIFNLLDGLKEPDRKELKTPLATGFWRELDNWKERVSVAARQKRMGDILLLTEEISNPLLKEEAISEAGRALKSMERYELALDQYRKGLEVNPRNLVFRREEAFNLNRIGRVNEAIVKIEGLLQDVPNDTEAIGTLGRIYKEMWHGSWKKIEDPQQRLQAAFDSYHWLLKSFQTYLRGYRIDLDECYPGINAHTLGTLLLYLAEQFEDKSQPDEDIQAVREIIGDLRGSLAFALETKTSQENADYWSFISLAELLVLTAEIPQQVTRAYRKALTASRRDEFQLRSSVEQLEMLRAIGVRPEFVQVGMNVINEELQRIRNEVPRDESKQARGARQAPQRKVFLFAGYRVSSERKRENQFPSEKEQETRAVIEDWLERQNAGSDDLAVTTGMDAGSEIIFVECCVRRGVPVEAYFPLYEAPYRKEFVSPGGREWEERFFEMRNHPLVSEFYQPDCVGMPKQGVNVHERNNRWALYSALVRGVDKVRLLALWDGKGESTRDLDARFVKHMVDLMRDIGGIVEHINPAKPPRPLKPQEKPAPNGSASRKPQRRKK